MKKQLFDREKNILFFINLSAVTVFFFMLIFYKHYSVDDYLMINDVENLHSNALNNGRYALMLIYDIFILFDFSPVIYQRILGILFGVALALCATGITHRIYVLGKIENRLSKVLINLASLLLFLNVFMIEWFYFVLSYAQWILAVIGAVYGAIYISHDSLRKKAVGALFVLIAANSYQVILAHYAVLVMIFLYLKYKNSTEGFQFGKLIKETLVAAVIAGISMAVNMAVSSLLTSSGIMAAESRYNALSLSLDNVLNIILSQIRIWIGGFGLMPHGILLISFVCFLGLYAGACFLRRPKAGEIVYSLLIFAGCVAVTFSPQLLVFSITPRNVVPVFALFGICLYFIAFWGENYRFLYKTAVVLAGLFFAVNFYYVQKTTVCMFQVNALEQEYALMIKNEVEKYEEQTGIAVECVGFGKDKNTREKYEQLRVYPQGTILKKAYMVSWGDASALNFYTGLNLQRVECDAAVQEYYSANDWDMFSPEEQLIFKGNTLYVGLY